MTADVSSPGLGLVLYTNKANRVNHNNYCAPWYK